MIHAIIAGPEEFGQSLIDQGAEASSVDWRPPPAAEALLMLFRLPGRIDEIEAANDHAVSRIVTSRCRLTSVERAADVIPGLEVRTLLHAGPPINWENASGPLRGALVGAVLHEGWADQHDSAEEILRSGQVGLSPCHGHQAVGPMAGVISPSMPVFVVENETFGNRAYATLNEGLGRVLRYGANDQSVLDRLLWLQEVCGPILRTAIRRLEGTDLTAMMAQAIQMGDELHNRNKAATALFTRELAPTMVSSGEPANKVAAVLSFMASADVFFLNLAMAACKATLDAASNVHNSTVVTAMARNGTEFGIRLSGTGDRWFTTPAPPVEGLFFPGYGPDDANPDIGDSAITETAGLGAFALAGAPAITQFIGGSAASGRAITAAMGEITAARHPTFQIPALDFEGSPVGIDAIRVCRTSIAPMLDTGIAHRQAGIGQIGAGVVTVPIEPFAEAVRHLASMGSGSAKYSE